MSRYQTVTGFVISRQDYGEADRILRLFTQEAGRMDAIARGVRRSKAKLASRIEPFFEVEWRIVASKGNGLATIIGAELKTHQRPNELEQLELGWAILEITDHSFRIDEDSQSWYDLLQASFQGRLGDKQSVVWLAALAKSLDQLGIHPDLPINDQKVIFRINDGELVSQGGGVELPAEYIKLWKVARVWPLDKLLRIKGAAEIAAQGNETLEQFWAYHSGRQLRSRQLH